ncbi:MAG: YrbL family protein [Pseudomonadota bacterium]
MIELSDDDYIGRGIAKIVYRHPFDPSLCIKFPNKSKKRAEQDILREIKYLKKHQENLPWLSHYRGVVNSNFGRGYAYELVKNEDGSPSVSLDKCRHTKDRRVLREKVSSMYFQLIDEHAVVNDLSLSNFLIKDKTDGNFDLILIDGFGNSNFIKIADFSRFLLLKKLNRKFTKLCRKLDIPSDFLV